MSRIQPGRQIQTRTGELQVILATQTSSMLKSVLPAGLISNAWSDRKLINVRDPLSGHSHLGHLSFLGK